MTRTIVFLMMLMSVLPSDGSTQAVPSPGDRIRIKQVDGRILTGTLATWSPETIQLVRTAAVPVARIEVLEISLGQRRNYQKYIFLTAAVTSVAGATIGGFWEPCGGTSWCIGPETRSEGIYVGFAIGALIGLPVGLILGSVFSESEERWNPVALPTPAESGLTIRPVIGSRVGFAGSIRVGGF